MQDFDFAVKPKRRSSRRRTTLVSRVCGGDLLLDVGVTRLWWRLTSQWHSQQTQNIFATFHNVVSWLQLGNIVVQHFKNFFFSIKLKDKHKYHVCLLVQVICAKFEVICSLFHKSMKLGTVVQVGALNIFRNGAIAKTPRGCHGDHFPFCHNQIMYFVSYLLN